ncbi:hypothetical protein B0G38_002087 [Arthrobacter sp. VKM Ac-2550]|nr:hypothetical protein [Arthrobacter sp. VKM Ac-2550]
MKGVAYSLNPSTYSYNHHPYNQQAILTKDVN